MIIIVLLSIIKTACISSASLAVQHDADDEFDFGAFDVSEGGASSYAALDLYTQPIMSSASFIAIIIIQSSDDNHAFLKANHDVHTLLHKLIK